MKRNLQAHGRADLLDSFNYALYLIKGEDKLCTDCHCVLGDDEVEEGRCLVCSNVNALDTYLTGQHPDRGGR